MASPATGSPHSPATAQPGYGQPGYGQPGGFPPYAGGYGQPGPPPKRGIRRFWPWLAGVAGVLVVLIIIGAVTGSNPNPGKNHTLSAPTQSAGYTKITGGLADQVYSSLTASVAGRYHKKDLTVAVYGPTGSSSPTFIFLGVHSSDFSDHAPSATIANFMKGAQVSNASPVDPGPLGGKMSCGTSTDGQTVCAWVDHNTLGGMVFVQLSGSAAAAEMRSFRSDAEK